MSVKKSHIRNLIVLPILIGAGVGGYVFMQNRPVTVDVVEPTAHVPIRVFGLGTVEAQVLSRVGFQVSGAVVELAADYGDKVALGSVLARLNVSEQRARRAGQGDKACRRNEHWESPRQCGTRQGGA